MRVNKKIGLGTVQFGVNYGISNKTGRTSKQEVVKILELAKKAGIEILDTAAAYGLSEKLLGDIKIEGFKVVSKFLPSDNKGNVKEQLNKSLNHLKLSKLYGYLAHRPASLLLDNNDWEELVKLKEKGKVEKIGYSLNSPEELTNLLEAQLIPDIIQIPFNIFDRRFESEAIKLHEKGCEIHTRSTFLQGLFFMNINELPDFFDNAKKEIAYLQSTFKEKLPNALLNYVLNQEFIDCTIVGVESKRQLLGNLERSELIAEVNNKLQLGEKILGPSQWPDIT